MNSCGSGNILAFEKIKSFLITAGDFLTVWENEVPLAITPESSIIKSMKYNFLNNSLYLGCSDSTIIVKSTQVNKFKNSSL